MAKKKIKKKVFTSADLDAMERSSREVFTSEDLDAMEEESLPNSTIIDNVDPNTLMKDEGTLDTWHAQNPMQTGLASLANMARGTTMGVSDLIAAGSRAVPGYLGDKSAGGDRQLKDIFLSELNKVNAPINDLNERSPVLTTGLQMLSGLPASKIMPAISDGGRLMTGLKSAGLGALGAAIYGGTTTEGDAEDRLGSSIVSGGVGGLLGGALGTAFGGPMPNLLRKSLRKLPEGAQSVLADLGINLSDEAAAPVKLNQAERAVRRRIPEEKTAQIAIDLHDAYARGDDVFLPEVVDADPFYSYAKYIRNDLEGSGVATPALAARDEAQPGVVDSVLSRLADNESLHNRGLAMRDQAQAYKEAIYKSREDLTYPDFVKSYQDVPEIEITPQLEKEMGSDLVRGIVSGLKGDFPEYREPGYGQKIKARKVAPIEILGPKGEIVSEVLPEQKMKIDSRSNIWQKILEGVGREQQNDIKNGGSRYQDLKNLKTRIEKEVYRSNPGLGAARAKYHKVSKGVDEYEANMISALTDLSSDNVASGVAKIMNLPIERIADFKQKIGNPELVETTTAAYLRNILGSPGHKQIEKLSKLTKRGSLYGNKMKLALGDAKYNELRELLDAQDLITKGNKKYFTGSSTHTNQANADVFRGELLTKKYWLDATSKKLNEWAGIKEKDVAEILFNQQKAREAVKNMVRAQSIPPKNIRGIQTTVAPVGGYAAREGRE